MFAHCVTCSNSERYFCAGLNANSLFQAELFQRDLAFLKAVNKPERDVAVAQCPGGVGVEALEQLAVSVKGSSCL